MAMLPKSRFISATAQILPNILRPIVPAVPILSSVEVPDLKVSKTKYISPVRLPFGQPGVTTSLTGTTQVRCTHSDVGFPNLDNYRRQDNKNAMEAEEVVNNKLFSYMLIGGGGVVGGYTGKHLVTKLITTMTTTQDVLALSKIEVEIGDIPVGKNVCFKWRGKPLYVRHRTAEEIEHAKTTNLQDLRDPQHDDDRTLREEWLVVLAICTHLGCVPVSGQGDYAELGGYYCPCHGSHYDSSGRIRKGPAPLNMEIPFYNFEGDSLLVVG